MELKKRPLDQIWIWTEPQRSLDQNFCWSVSLSLRNLTLF